MKFIFIIIFSFTSISVTTGIELKQENLDKIENFVFQDNITPNQFFFNELISQNIYDDFLNEIEISYSNSYYNKILIDLISDNDSYPKEFNKSDFFLYKIQKLSKNNTHFFFLRELFSSVLFEKFNNPEFNEIYLKYLFDYAKFEELCSFYSDLNNNEKLFDSNIIFSTICLLENVNFSQLDLLLEIYDKKTILNINSIYLNSFIKDKLISDTVDYQTIGLIDKYILFKNPNFFSIKNINLDNVFDAQIYINNEKVIDPNIIYNAYRNRIINKNEFLSIANRVKDSYLFPEYVTYDLISSQITINEKLRVISENLENINMDYYDFSRLIIDNFDNTKLVKGNLKYANSIFLLLLSSEQNFITNFISLLDDYEFTNEFDALFFEGINNFLSQNKTSDVYYVNNAEFINNPIIMFFIQNDYLKIELDIFTFFNLPYEKILSNNYSQLLIHWKLNDDKKAYIELLDVLNSIEFKYINEIELNYLNPLFSYNDNLNQLFFNIISYRYFSH